ncbi:MAG: histidinol-phosphatase [Lachnospiraceae bacterium]|nr:histidinol-phosphatase [Lachnospiraceae bacterium]
MIQANYHTHTPRCKHAEGSEREYIEAAIANGFKTLGFSDHTPQPFDDGFVSGIRMDMEELDGYVDTLKALREEYADRIDIRIGLEVEYYPSCFDKLMKEVRKRDIDYLILGQHFVPEEQEGFYAGSKTDRTYDIDAYIDAVIEALETKEFMYLAHPDLIHYIGDNEIYLSHMKRLCEYTSDKEVPLEINGLGMLTGRWYPREDFFKLAVCEGCSFIFGCDAHKPTQVIQPEGIRGMDGFLEETGVIFS